MGISAHSTGTDKDRDRQMEPAQEHYISHSTFTVCPRSLVFFFYKATLYKNVQDFYDKLGAEGKMKEGRKKEKIASKTG